MTNVPGTISHLGSSVQPIAPHCVLYLVNRRSNQNEPSLLGAVQLVGGWVGKKRWAHGVVVSTALPESSQGRRGGGRETCGGTLPSFHDVKTVHWRWPGSARGTGEKGAETSVPAL